LNVESQFLIIFWKRITFSILLTCFIYFVDPNQKKPKCAKYWPNEEKEDKVFGHMQVKFVAQSMIKNDKDKTVDEVIQRTFSVSNGTSGKYVSSLKISNK
jgi:protein tyrosine phosphatase